jgi:large conductance mechanosensitive channel
MNEFKKFILRGNVIDLAVGVIIGGAFGKIVTSLVDDIIMPVLSVVIGKISLDHRFISLDGNFYATLEEAGTAPLLKYGNFISTVINFLLMGLVIFFLVKSINFIRDKMTLIRPEEAAPAVVKTCPFCISEIHIDATVCPKCTSKIRDGVTE